MHESSVASSSAAPFADESPHGVSAGPPAKRARATSPRAAVPIALLFEEYRFKPSG